MRSTVKLQVVLRDGHGGWSPFPTDPEKPLHLVLPVMERSDLDGWLRMNLEKVFLHGFHPIHGLRLESFSSTEPSARNASPFGRRESILWVHSFPSLEDFPSWEPLERLLPGKAFRGEGVVPAWDQFLPETHLCSNHFMAKIDHNYKGLNSYGKKNEQLLKNMAYTAPEQSFLMDREKLQNWNKSSRTSAVARNLWWVSTCLIPMERTTDPFLGDALRLQWIPCWRRSRTVPLVCTPSSLELIFEQGIAFPKSRMTAHTMSIRMGSMSSVRRGENAR